MSFHFIVVAEGQLSNYDKDVLKRIIDIEKLTEKDKKHMFYNLQP